MTVEELKCKGEEFLQAFKNVIKELNALGFNVAANPDDTLYVFKQETQITEEYGTKPPQHPALAVKEPDRKLSLVSKPECCDQAANGAEACKGEN